VQPASRKDKRRRLLRNQLIISPTSGTLCSFFYYATHFQQLSNAITPLRPLRPSVHCTGFLGTEVRKGRKGGRGSRASEILAL